MRIVPISVALAVTTALIPIMARPAHAAVEERVYVETAVDSDRNGRPDRIAIDISRPTGGGQLPVIFEHSPYRTPLNNVPNHGVDVDRLPQEGLLTAQSAGTAGARPVPGLPG